MNAIRKMAAFLKDESGATMVEYGLMIALIAVVCVVTVAAIGTNLNTKFESIKNQLTGTGS